MSAAAIEIIESELTKYRGVVSTLEKALALLKDNSVDVAPQPKQKLLAPPEKPQPKGRAGTGVFAVNGVDFTLGAKPFALIEAIAGADDCIPIEQLQPIFGGSRLYVQQCVSALNKKLRTAKAEIVHFRGEGYRLQNIVEDA